MEIDALAILSSWIVHDHLRNSVIEEAPINDEHYNNLLEKP